MRRSLIDAALTFVCAAATVAAIGLFLAILGVVTLRGSVGQSRLARARSAVARR